MIDCFMFLNELTILEIRLNSLAPYVERFVLVESPFTFSGKPKPLYFQENKERFKDFNITHLIMDNFTLPDAIEDKNWLSQTLERKHRDFLMNGIEDVDPETIILSSDIDEIPNLEMYDDKTEGVFSQREYCYYVNVFSGKRRVKGTIAFKKKNIPTLSFLRSQQKSLPIIAQNSGWHFTFIGSDEDTLYQMDSGCHCLEGSDKYSSQILDNRKKLRSPFYGVWNFNSNRKRQFNVEEPSGPKWLLQNKEKYEHLWYTNGSD